MAGFKPPLPRSVAGAGGQVAGSGSLPAGWESMGNSCIFAPPVGSCLQFQSGLSGLNAYKFQELCGEARMCC